MKVHQRVHQNNGNYNKKTLVRGTKDKKLWVVVITNAQKGHVEEDWQHEKIKCRNSVAYLYNFMLLIY